MPANAVRFVLLGTSSYTPSRGHASRVLMTPVSCAMPKDGTKTSWEANCVNPFSKVGVRAAQDGGVHLEKKIFDGWCNITRSADAGREGTPPCHFCCKCEPRWLSDGPLLVTY